MSQFAVLNDASESVKQAFRDRPHLVEDAPGFRRLEVLSPVDAKEEIWLLTYWDDEASFNAWYKTHHFKAAHKAIPQGVRLEPGRTKLRGFDWIAG